MKEEISERFLEFAARMVKLGKPLNKSFEGRHIYGQMFRSGTSSGANYEESHSAQSTRDFIHKREISLKELQSLYWLRLIERTKLVSSTNDELTFLMTENQELIKIIAKSVVSTKKNKLNTQKK